MRPPPVDTASMPSPRSPVLSPRSKVFTVHIKTPRKYNGGVPVWAKVFQLSGDSTKSLSVDVATFDSDDERKVTSPTRILASCLSRRGNEPVSFEWPSNEAEMKRSTSDSSFNTPSKSSPRSAYLSPHGAPRSIKIQSTEHNLGASDTPPPSDEMTVQLFGPDGLCESSEEGNVIVSDVAKFSGGGGGDDEDEDGFVQLSFNVTVFDAPPDAEFHCQVVLPSNVCGQRAQTSHSGGSATFLWKFLLFFLLLAPWTNAFLQAPAFKAARRLVASGSWSPQANDYGELWPAGFPGDGVLTDGIGSAFEDLTRNALPVPSDVEHTMRKSAKLVGLKSVHAKKSISATAATQDVRTVLANSAADFAATLVSSMLTTVHPSLEGADLSSVDDLRAAITSILNNATHSALATDEDVSELQSLLSAIKISIVPKPADAAGFLMRNALIPAVAHHAVSSVVDSVVSTCEAVEGVVRCPSAHSHFFDTVLQIAHVLPSIPPS